MVVCSVGIMAVIYSIMVPKQLDPPDYHPIDRVRLLHLLAMAIFRLVPMMRASMVSPRCWHGTGKDGLSYIAPDRRGKGY